MTFHDQKDKSEKTVQVPLGQSLLEAAHNNDIDLEGGKKVALVPFSFSTPKAAYFKAPLRNLTAVQALVKALWPVQHVMW